MKATIASLLLIFLTTSLLPAQDITKGANAIVITGDFLKEDKFTEITTLLLESGIKIDRSDKETGSITTSLKSFKNGSIAYIIFVRDNSVVVRGEWSSNIIVSMYGVTSNPNEIQEITYGGQKGSPKRNAWETFRSVADQIPGDKNYVVK